MFVNNPLQMMPMCFFLYLQLTILKLPKVTYNQNNFGIPVFIIVHQECKQYQKSYSQPKQYVN